MRKSICLTFFASMLICIAIAQQKILQAIEITAAPNIDGLLDDDSWKNIPEATDFITYSPIFNDTSIVKTSVKVAYDNSAIYIGAYLYEQPSLIRKQFTSRDNENYANVDYFSVFLDTYNDRQNGYQFLVTTRNVQTDARLSSSAKQEYGRYGDLSWDAVWHSKVSMQKDGWSVEIKIPYFSLRFAKKNVQDWGINFLRFTRRINEVSFWNKVNPNMNGFVNQFGNLQGLEKLAPPLRLSFSPYISGGYRMEPYKKTSFTHETLRSGGLDVKYGLNESFTLDATLVPDFGQTISDNLINNITPFEQQFKENRPFFTEGTELFNKSGIFYSRRIGDIPKGYYNVKDLANVDSYRVIKNLSVTKLYNAIKFSGRNKNNLGIGIFNSITQPVNAKVNNNLTGKDSTIRTEELANYNIIVLDQALKNRSSITLTNTNVIRKNNKGNANVTSLDVSLYDNKNRYRFFLSPKYSQLFGNTNYGGFMNSIQFGKVSGKFQWHINNDIISDTYNPNDMGYLYPVNQINNEAELSYNIFQSSKKILNQRYAFTVKPSYLYKPFGYQTIDIKPSVFFIFKNFWDITLEVPIQPFWYYDYFELQTSGKKLKRSPYYSVFFNGSSDSRKKLFVNWNLGFAEGPLPKDPYYDITLGARYRFNDKLNIDASVRWQHDHGQWGLTNNGEKFIFDALTQEPIIARRIFTDVVSVLSGSYAFTSRMNLTFRARHYWNQLLNTNLYNSNADGSWTERFDIKPSDYNANCNIFNLDVFYTWDFKLGSKVIIGYKNWLGNDYLNSLKGTRNKYYSDNLINSFNLPHGNELTLRFIYFLNYQNVVKNKKL